MATGVEFLRGYNGTRDTTVCEEFGGSTATAGPMRERVQLSRNRARGRSGESLAASACWLAGWGGSRSRLCGERVYVLLD